VAGGGARALRGPVRCRAIVAARRLHLAGTLGAADSVWIQAQRFPADPDLHYLFADINYHSSPFGIDRFVLYQQFEVAMRLDPASAAPYVHPLEVAVLFGDRDRFDRYLAGLSGSVDSATLRGWEVVASVRWAAPEAARERYIRSFYEGAVVPHRTMTGGLIHATLGAEPPRPDLLLAAYHEQREMGVAGAPGAAPDPGSMAALIGLGQVRAARAPLDSLLEAGAWIWVRHAQVMPVLFGLAPASRMHPQTLTPLVTPDAAERFYLQALVAIRGRDLERGRQLLRAAAAADTAAGGIYRRRLYARFAALWAEADPELQPLVARARAAEARLAATVARR
jgi:hypothetical protein